MHVLDCRCPVYLIWIWYSFWNVHVSSYLLLGIVGQEPNLSLHLKPNLSLHLKHESVIPLELIWYIVQLVLHYCCAYQWMDNYHYFGQMAMSGNDIIISGAKSLFFLDYFAASHLDVDLAKRSTKSVHLGSVNNSRLKFISSAPLFLLGWQSYGLCHDLIGNQRDCWWLPNFLIDGIFMNGFILTLGR